MYLYFNIVLSMKSVFKSILKLKVSSKLATALNIETLCWNLHCDNTTKYNVNIFDILIKHLELLTNEYGSIICVKR